MFKRLKGINPELSCISTKLLRKIACSLHTHNLLFIVTRSGFIIILSGPKVLFWHQTKHVLRETLCFNSVLRKNNKYFREPNVYTQTSFVVSIVTRNRKKVNTCRKNKLCNWHGLLSLPEVKLKRRDACIIKKNKSAFRTP